MNLSRRDFIKLFGITVASLTMTRCKFPPLAAETPGPTATPTPLPPRDMLRLCWQRFDELAQTTVELSDTGEEYMENALGEQLVADHRHALAELVAAGESTQPVADLVQEGYEAAVYHVWRSNIPVTCYEPVIVDYEPASARVLVQQSEMLNEFAQAGEIDPETLAQAQAALEHDMAFIAMSDADIDLLYQQMIADWENQSINIPSFADLSLEPSAEAIAAARFIIELLTEE